MRGKFIVIEGIDYSGKGTQIELLKGIFPDFYYAREPGGTPIAEDIRNMLLTREGPRSNPLTDFFLFFAARASHIGDAIMPQLETGRHVICDRYDSSTFAFQIRAEQRSELEPLFWAVRGQLPPVYYPDAYVFLDLSAKAASERSEAAGSRRHTRFDAKPLEFHERVRTGFDEFAKRIHKTGSGTTVHVIDADRKKEEVSHDLQKFLRDFLAL